MKFKPMVSNFVPPTYGTPGSAGFDIPNANTHSMEHHDIDTGGVVSLKLGFCAAVPTGYVGLIFPRSSAGSNFGIELVNTVGVIDSDFRDEWQVKFTYKRCLNGALSKPALFQCVVVPVNQVSIDIVGDLDETDRNGGWGSTDTTYG